VPLKNTFFHANLLHDHYANRGNSNRLTIGVPPQVPTGRTDIIIQFPVCEDAQPLAALLPVNGDGKIRLTK